MKAPSEKHLEDWIVNNFAYFGDIWEGDRLDPHPSEADVLWVSDTEYIFPYSERLLKRQVHFPFGVADLIAKGFSNVQAIELKAGGIDGETVAQVQRYMTALTHIYKEVAQRARDDTPEAKEHLPYWEMLSIDAGLNAVSGVVVGHSLKDKNLLPLCSALGIDVVLYDYDPSNNSYRFQRQGGAWVIGAHMVGVAGDFAEGALGAAFREVIVDTIAYSKHQKGRSDG